MNFDEDKRQRRTLNYIDNSAQNLFSLIHVFVVYISFEWNENSCFIPIVESLGIFFNMEYAQCASYCIAYHILMNVFEFVKKNICTSSFVFAVKKYTREMYSTASGDAFFSVIKIYTRSQIHIYLCMTQSHIVISSLKTLLWDFFPSNKLNAFHFSFQILSSKDKQKLFRNRKRKNCVNLHIFIAQTHTESWQSILFMFISRNMEIIMFESLGQEFA